MDDDIGEILLVKPSACVNLKTQKALGNDGFPEPVMQVVLILSLNGHHCRVALSRPQIVLDIVRRLSSQYMLLRQGFVQNECLFQATGFRLF
jgi:hypothetical protein